MNVGWAWDERGMGVGWADLDVVVICEARITERLRRVDLHLLVGRLVPQPAQPDALARRAA
eukprot:3800844-Prymnesium_polylepis.1